LNGDRTTTRSQESTECIELGGRAADAVDRRHGFVGTGIAAPGGVAVGVSGKGVEGYLPGKGLLASLGLGMITAEHAVASLDQ
jgi:hypothetical protein